MSVNSSYLCILDLKMRINWKLFSQLIEVSYGNCVFCFGGSRYLLSNITALCKVNFPHFKTFRLLPDGLYCTVHTLSFSKKKNPNTINALALTGLADPWRGTVNFCVPAMEGLPMLSSWWIELLRSSSILLLKPGA